MSKEDKLYLGRAYDLKSAKVLDRPTLYDPDDLTTHGVVVGMTGSGKTGLCVDILEEAALKGIPALMVDPKGDIANLLLHFPDLSPESFKPWVDPDEARRKDLSIDELAAKTADTWREGLAEWGIEPNRIRQVKEAVRYAVYTPGSDAGLPVNILASLKAPGLDWGEAEEALREQVSSTVTAILALIGVEADPVRSREHILLATIFEHAWREGKDLDLVELIRQAQNPPFEKLGALELEQFYPSDDRFELVTALNGLLASPSFQAWIEGQPLEIDSFLWAPDGTPKQSVFYLAHLSDAERMFFVTLLLSAVESWLRNQPGSSSLRALLYFDELFGYMPPVANPPTKEPLLRLLKTARAYGLGLLLVTQNPVDLDYKGLGNAGTWFVGKLQAERDKSRLLDGLEGTEAASAGFNRKSFDKIISDLDKRVFLLHNVHAKEPELFQTRWAMAYLRGPITREQLDDLNASVGAGGEMPAAPAIEAAPPVGADGSRVKVTEAGAKPPVQAGIEEYFLPNNVTVAQALKEAGQPAEGVSTGGVVYRPALLAQATARFLNRKIGLDYDKTCTALVLKPGRRGIVRWDEHESGAVLPESLDAGPAPEAGFAEINAPLSDAKAIKQLRGDFLDHVYHGAELRLPANSELDLVADPEDSLEAFQEQCKLEAEKALQAETKKVSAKYQKQIKALQRKLSREERELAEDQAELSARKMEEMATHAENVISLFTKSRRRVTTSLTKRRLTEQAKADVEESIEVIEEFKVQLAELEDQLAEELDDLQEQWSDVASQIEEKVFTPYKKDVSVELFGVAWFPYWQLSAGEGEIELPGYKA